MTLVVAIKTQYTIYMLADLMLSVATSNSNEPELDFPTRPLVSVVRTRSFVGLTQKIVLLLPGLFVGWSGNYDKVVKFLAYMKMSLSSRPSKEEISKAQKDYFALHERDLEDVHLLMIYEIEEGGYLFSQGSVYKEQIPNLGTAYAIGSGASQFINYAIRNPPKAITAIDNVPEDIGVVSYIMEYILETMFKQRLTGFGIGEGWGGGFEVVLKKGGEKLEKLDNIMLMANHWDIINDKVVTSQCDKRYYQYYENEFLTILSQAENEKVMFYRIPSLLSKSGDSFDLPRRKHPQLLCCALINSATNKYRIPLYFNFDGHKFCGVAEKPDSGVSIFISNETLGQLIRDVAMPDAE